MRVFIFLCVLCVSTSNVALAESEGFQKAYALYAYGDFKEAAKQFHSLLYPLVLKDKDEILKAYQYLGICYYLLDQRLAAENEFRAILRTEPHYSLDPLFTPPQIMDFFNVLKREIGMEAQRRKALFYLNFVPFGVGQFQNGQKTKGYIFLGVEGTALLTNLVTYYVRKTMETSPDHYWKKDVKTANRLQDAQLIAFWVFVGTGVYGIVDAVWNSPTEAERDGISITAR